MTQKVSLGIVAACLIGLLASLGLSARQATDGVVRIDTDDIGGVVRSPEGPEAGVWVIAETNALPSKFIRIVVTDGGGRYLLPDLPPATYDIWVRGYGLVDSPKVKAAPGTQLNLTTVIARTPSEAAQYYPANYWASLIRIPDKSEFPGTGPEGNGIPKSMETQAHWISHMKASCQGCHQLGGKATREIPESLGRFESSAAAWERRTAVGQMGPPMAAAFARFGTERAAAIFSDWTDRVDAGEVPPAPPRPEGVERNVVITLWDVSDHRAFVHDTISTDKRRPTINANGLVYSVSRFSPPELPILDPLRHTVIGLTAPVRDPDTPFTTPQEVLRPSPYWGNEIIWSSKPSLHNPMMDHMGRLWITHAIRHPNKNPDFCRPGSTHPSAQLFPIERSARQLSLFDTETRQFTLIDTCFGTHHLQFAEDAANTLWFSGGGEVVGWFNTKMFEETGDPVKSQGWTAFILDTNGNGRRDEYVGPDDPIDPTKDKRIRNDGFTYGVIVNPVDGAIWLSTMGMPGSILRVSPGPNPPATALAEVYIPPFNNPNSPVNGYTPRGIDIDRNGVVWTGLTGSGHLASFDRRKCNVLNGPTATGQQCPEGWKLYRTPGPSYSGASDDSSAQSLYYNWVDQFDTFGLGTNVPIGNGDNADALLALLPDSGKFLVFNIPYPLGFYHRGVDGRIDDPNAGWKGRGLWANYGSYNAWHNEGGKGTKQKVVRFQLRPDPLAK